MENIFCFDHLSNGRCYKSDILFRKPTEITRSAFALLSKSRHEFSKRPEPLNGIYPCVTMSLDILIILRHKTLRSCQCYYYIVLQWKYIGKSESVVLH